MVHTSTIDRAPTKGWTKKTIASLATVAVTSFSFLAGCAPNKVSAEPVPASAPAEPGVPLDAPAEPEATADTSADEYNDDVLEATNDKLFEMTDDEVVKRWSIELDSFETALQLAELDNERLVEFVMSGSSPAAIAALREEVGPELSEQAIEDYANGQLAHLGKLFAEACNGPGKKPNYQAAELQKLISTVYATNNSEPNTETLMDNIQLKRKVMSARIVSGDLGGPTVTIEYKTIGESNFETSLASFLAANNPAFERIQLWNAAETTTITFALVGNKLVVAGGAVEQTQ